MFDIYEPIHVDPNDPLLSAYNELNHLKSKLKSRETWFRAGAVTMLLIGLIIDGFSSGSLKTRNLELLALHTLIIFALWPYHYFVINKLRKKIVHRK